MFQKKKKCGVCGYRVAPDKEKVYVAEEPRAFMETLTKPPLRFNAIDCPRCGCQIMLTIRADRVNLAPAVERDEPEESEVAENED